MNKYVLTLLCVGFAGAAWAQDAPCPVPCPVCCAPKVCVPVPGVKDKTKVIYDDKCVDYCLPRCSLLSIFSGGCGCTGGCPNCGTPRVRRVLIKRIVHEECPETKCEVQGAPLCPGPCPPGP